jgi:hypothetical protein
MWYYLLWQQLSVQSPLQQVWPHLPWQQSLQYMALAVGAVVCATAATARTTAKERNAMVRLMEFSLTSEMRLKSSLKVFVNLVAASLAFTSEEIQIRKTWFRM